MSGVGSMSPFFGQQVKAFDMQSDTPFADHHHVPIMNLVVGVICLGFLTVGLSRMSIRLIRCRQLRKKW